LPGVDSPALVEKIQATGDVQVTYAESIDVAVEEAVAAARSGDVIITLGAGSIWRAGDSLLTGLEARFAPTASTVEATS
jgi:UDP-N-acetylmuramate--alanine ligase